MAGAGLRGDNVQKTGLAGAAKLAQVVDTVASGL